MEMVKNALSWFEIPVTDFERARKFYSGIFDFVMPEMSMRPNKMGFLLSEQVAGVGGAIVSGPGYVPPGQGTLVYLNGGVAQHCSRPYRESWRSDPSPKNTDY